jgi:4'-phosphopantetheinyl transferase
MPQARLAWLSQGVADAAPGEAWLSPREAAQALLRFPKRSDAFRLGRWTAKKALALSLGRDAAPEALRSIEIGRAADGAPLPLVDGRPAAASLSLTGRADQAVALVGPSGIGLGCDLEVVEPRSAAFVADYLTAAERRLVNAARGGGAGDLVANVVWSAKESALKILRTGLRRDTRSLEVSLAAGSDGWASMSIRAAEGRAFPGWWRRFGAFVLTVAGTRPFPPPPSLVEPPGLGGAIPGESWLGRRAAPLVQR